MKVVATQTSWRLESPSDRRLFNSVFKPTTKQIPKLQLRHEGHVKGIKDGCPRIVEIREARRVVSWSETMHEP